MGKRLQLRYYIEKFIEKVIILAEWFNNRYYYLMYYAVKPFADFTSYFLLYLSSLRTTVWFYKLFSYCSVSLHKLFRNYGSLVSLKNNLYFLTKQIFYRIFGLFSLKQRVYFIKFVFELNKYRNSQIAVLSKMLEIYRKRFQDYMEVERTDYLLFKFQLDEFLELHYPRFYIFCTILQARFRNYFSSYRNLWSFLLSSFSFIKRFVFSSSLLIQSISLNLVVFFNSVHSMLILIPHLIFYYIIIIPATFSLMMCYPIVFFMSEILVGKPIFLSLSNSLRIISRMFMFLFFGLCKHFFSLGRFFQLEIIEDICNTLISLILYPLSPIISILLLFGLVAFAVYHDLSLLQNLGQLTMDIIVYYPPEYLFAQCDISVFKQILELLYNFVFDWLPPFGTYVRESPPDFEVSTTLYFDEKTPLMSKLTIILSYPSVIHVLIKRIIIDLLLYVQLFDVYKCNSKFLFTKLF